MSQRASDWNGGRNCDQSGPLWHRERRWFLRADFSNRVNRNVERSKLRPQLFGGELGSLTDPPGNLRIEPHGPREFGKIRQKLLALAFHGGGCGHVVERGFQGVDIDAAWEQEKWTIEVKTTIGDRVFLAPKDVAGLASRRRDGYRPLLAVLRLSALSDRLIADAVQLVAGCHDVELLRPYRQRVLEQRLRPLFDQALETHFDGALPRSQTYLDRVWQAQGVEVMEWAVLGQPKE